LRQQLHRLRQRQNQTCFFFDDKTYNPCRTKSGLFFYPHPTDYHQYFQCDETGNAYLRSCGELVWDDLRIACNWPSSAAPLNRVHPIETATSSTTTTTESSSSTAAPPSTLCMPVNPCGEHGTCLESPKKVPSSARRFACICSENWFGRMCDKNIDELTTPPTMVLDHNQNISETIDTISLPVKTKKDSKYIFYGLKGSNTVPEIDRTQKRQSSSK